MKNLQYGYMREILKVVNNIDPLAALGVGTLSKFCYRIIWELLAPKASEASWGLSIFSRGSKWLLLCVCVSGYCCVCV